MAKRIRIGDVVEVMTSKGMAYAQVAHLHREEHSAYGPFLRIAPGFFTKRPERFEELLRKEPIATMFCALRAAVKGGICEIVGNVPVPEAARSFPLFRGSNNLPGGTTPKTWWFWDGERTWFVGKITPKQRTMPLREIVDGVVLRERIESGWSPATDPYSQ
jgi:hypothetical protein